LEGLLIKQEAERAHHDQYVQRPLLQWLAEPLRQGERHQLEQERVDAVTNPAGERERKPASCPRGRPGPGEAAGQDRGEARGQWDNRWQRYHFIAAGGLGNGEEHAEARRAAGRAGQQNPIRCGAQGHGVDQDREEQVAGQDRLYQGQRPEVQGRRLEGGTRDRGCDGREPHRPVRQVDQQPRGENAALSYLADPALLEHGRQAVGQRPGERCRHGGYQEHYRSLSPIRMSMCGTGTVTQTIPPSPAPRAYRNRAVRYCLVTMGRRPYPPGVLCRSGR